MCVYIYMYIYMCIYIDPTNMYNMYIYVHRYIRWLIYCVACSRLLMCVVWCAVLGQDACPLEAHTRV